MSLSTLHSAYSTIWLNICPCPIACQWVRRGDAETRRRGRGSRGGDGPVRWFLLDRPIVGVVAHCHQLTKDEVICGVKPARVVAREVFTVRRKFEPDPGLLSLALRIGQL